MLAIGKSITPKGGHKKEFEREFAYHGEQHANAVIDKIIAFFSSCATHEVIRERKLPEPMKFVKDFVPTQERVSYGIGHRSAKRTKRTWLYRANMINCCTLVGIGYLRQDGKVMIDGAPTDEKVWFIVDAATDCSGPYSFIYDGGYEYHMIKRLTMKVTESPMPVAGFTGYMKTKERRDLRLSAGDKELLDAMIAHHLKT